MIKINLLPDIILQRRKEAHVKKTAMTLFLVWVGVIAFAVVLVISYGQYHKFALARAEEERTELDAEVNSAENVEFREEALAVQTSLDTLQNLFGNRRSASSFFGVLADTMPDSVRIIELNFSEESNMLITGSARSFPAVSAFEAALKESGTDFDVWLESDDYPENPPAEGYFTTVELLSASLSDGNQIRFEIRATYNAHKAPSIANEQETEGGSE